jgi:signal peptidase I
VKRVIGLPGDELLFEAGAPIINGWRVPRCSVGTAFVSSEQPDIEYAIFVEFLQGLSYVVAQESGRDDGRQGPYRVRKDEFWVIGDNRNNSSDSRAWAGGRGAGVPLENLKGRAWWLWLPAERVGVGLHTRPVLPRSLATLQPQLERCLAQAPDLAGSTPPAPAESG